MILISLIGLGIFIIYRIVDRIENLTEVMDKISMGDMNAYVSDKLKNGTDEISKLAQAFDRIVVSLKLSLKKNEKK